MEKTKTNDRQQQIINQELKKGGLRGRINAMCAECIFDPFSGGGNWRQQVSACTSQQCPLYDVRPISIPKLEASNWHSQSLKTGDRTNG